jgi:hypothetical protein
LFRRNGKIVSGLLAASLLTASLCGCSAGDGEMPVAAAPAESKTVSAAHLPKLANIASSQVVQGMEKVSESEVLKLFLNRETTEVAVVDKRSGSVWYSNPPQRDKDTKAQGVTKDQLSSQITLSYYNNDGQKYTLNSYSDSVRYKQFEIQKQDDGVRVVYQFGDPSKGMDALPKRMSKERFEALLAKVPKNKGNNVKNKYKWVEAPGVYERWDSALAGINLKKTVTAFEEAGYTAEDLALDNKENGMGDGAAGDAKPRFTVPLEYRLEGDHLNVIVKAGEIKYPEAYPLNQLNILDFFGAADSTAQGYIFVPDGSGSLIRLNNGKLDQESYSQPVYGLDHAITEVEKSQTSETTRLPVFGLKQANQAFLAVIEDGDALASVNADISGRLNSYNIVYSDFTIVAKDELKMFGGNDGENTIQIFPKGSYKGNLAIRYSFLNGDQANYSGMAAAYRDYLVGKYGLKPTADGQGVPFYLDLIGDIPRRTSFLGIPYDKMEPLTTFAQAGAIIDELTRRSIGNIKVRYTGWFNKGYNHKPPRSISVDGAAGGRKGLMKLASSLRDKGIALYPDVAFLNIYQDTLRFSPSREASRYISRKVVKRYPYDPATFKKSRTSRSSYYVLSPRMLPSYVKDFSAGLAALGLQGLSLRDMGEEVNSDYKIGRQMDRQNASNVIAQQTAGLRKRFEDLMLIGGNANTLGYAKHVLQAPESDSRFGITDASVPFYQMAIHGYISYAGKPVNMGDDQDIRTGILKALETGSGVYFEWMYADPAAIKDTEFTNLYSVNYRYWLEDSVKMYREVNQVLAGVAAFPITKHEIVSPGVTKTTYGNGQTVIVNRTDTPAEVDGVSVGAMNYVAGGEQR